MHPVCGGSGHEILGDILQVIEPSTLNVRQRVLAFPPLYVKIILGDKYRRATGGRDPAELPSQGGFSEYFISHSCACIPVPATTPSPRFDPFWYVAAQPLGTILHACRRLPNLIGKDIAIVGQGQDGLLMTQMVSGMGARRIIVLDKFQYRLKVAATAFKATHTIHVANMNNDKIQQQILQITENNLCDVVVDMVGHQDQTIDLCVQLAKPCGTVLLFGLPPAPSEPQMQIKSWAKNLSYITTISPEMETFQHAMELLQQGRLDPSALFTHALPFERFAEAYAKASNYKDNVIKVLLTF